MVKNILLQVGGVGGRVGGWEEKWGLKLTSARVEVEVEAELGNYELNLKTKTVVHLFSSPSPMISFKTEYCHTLF